MESHPPRTSTSVASHTHDRSGSRSNDSNSLHEPPEGKEDGKPPRRPNNSSPYEHGASTTRGASTSAHGQGAPRLDWYDASLQPESREENAIIQHPLPPSSHQRNNSVVSRAPTWTGNDIARGGRRNILPAHRDPNRTPVTNLRWVPRPQSPPPPPVNSPGPLAIDQEGAEPPTDDTTDDGWDPTSARLSSWAAGVPPVPPPDNPPTPATDATSTRAASDIDLPPRPSSARQVREPTTVYYSDDGGSSPKLRINEPIDRDESKASEGGDGDSIVSAAPESPRPPTFTSPQPNSFPPAPLPAASVTSGRNSMQEPAIRRRPYAHPTKWWRQEMHPMHNPQFANRRLCVK